MTMTSSDNTKAIAWENDHLRLLDQRRLPQEVVYLDITDANMAASAIRDMVVRGAPAIGITAAYAIVLAAGQHYAGDAANWKARIEVDLDALAAARPTAVNLFWAIARMRQCLQGLTDNPVPALLAEAVAIHEEDIAANRKMGELGAALIDAHSGVLTHCNAGALATGGYGTALGVIRSAHAAGKLTQVYADETRPWLQGARLTAWELLEDHIPVNLIVDGAAAALMQSGAVQWFIVGSDRIAANGDVANKIGTYAGAILAKHHGLKVMVVAPTSTIDMSVATGTDIPIETRDGTEILALQGQQVAAAGCGAWNPVFDVTPAALVDAIVTEKGVVEHPDAAKMAALMAS
ncbi:S-methyl-5-thioribose-1-phosphate isomerase [Sulfuriflexus sp.]|uniref:S-methyl-5-thioribose-1-phosphate isomerase n=1 Tax=Sulfuriflexus sp. TaxID=2015443 RepID=UPI0028CE31EF|nr:S-methyl-5-thioribose-1-phosphate isomerase [Sulfuriflexus sp.]MDT8404879.1 S-methyl-5-thioribose-1-phosphate isomerase [Sulfuriflexus sp.]